MATKKVRGTKRTCQNGDCGVRFYDLERNPIICPMCEAEYVVARAPTAVVKEVVVPKPEPIAEKKEDDDTPAEEELVDAEADAVVGESNDDNDAFLEEEEDGNDVTGLVGGDKPSKAVE